MLNLRIMRSNILDIMESLKDSILRQVNDTTSTDKNIDYEKNQLVWHTCQIALINNLIETTNKDTISGEEWEEEIKNLDKLGSFLKYN